MQFLYPSFLWALLALAIPVIIHLFYFRRFKKVYFTNVKFLQEIKEETSSRNKLKNLLILLMRMLALAALVFAFAQPFIPVNDTVKKGNNAVSIFIDNSFSMRSELDEVPLIDVAKAKARSIIDGYRPIDRFQILTHDFEGRHQRLVSKEDALALIDEIDITPNVQSISKIIRRQKQALDQQEENEIAYILSDYQQSIVGTDLPIDSTLEVNFVPIQSIQERNVAIDTAFLESTVAMMNQPNAVIVNIKNFSEEPVEGIRLSVSMDGQEKPEGVFSIDGGQTITDTVLISILSPGTHQAVLKISDFPIQFDDSYHVILNVPENISVMAIHSGKRNRFLDALFSGIDLYDFSNINQTSIDYGQLSNQDLVILNDLESISSGMANELVSFINEGGKVLMFPGAEADIDNLNSFLSKCGANILEAKNTDEQTVAYLNEDEFIFSDVYEYVGRNLKLPTSSLQYKLSNLSGRKQEQLLSFRGGDPFLVKSIKGKGMLYLCTAPLDQTYNSLTVQAEVFVPMIYKMAISSTLPQKLSYTIGKDQVIEVAKSKGGQDLVYTFKGPTEFIPGQINLGKSLLLDVKDQISEDGFYQMMDGSTTSNTYAFNYDRVESDMNIIDTDGLEEVADEYNYNVISGSLNADFSELITEKDRGIALWKYFLVLTLIFLLIETILLRMWKE